MHAIIEKLHRIFGIGEEHVYWSMKEDRPRRHQVATDLTKYA